MEHLSLESIIPLATFGAGALIGIITERLANRGRRPTLKGVLMSATMGALSGPLLLNQFYPTPVVEQITNFANSVSSHIMPVVNAIGNFVLGFAGGVLAPKLWEITVGNGPDIEYIDRNFDC